MLLLRGLMHRMEHDICHHFSFQIHVWMNLEAEAVKEKTEMVLDQIL